MYVQSLRRTCTYGCYGDGAHSFPVLLLMASSSVRDGGRAARDAAGKRLVAGKAGDSVRQARDAAPGAAAACALAEQHMSAAGAQDDPRLDKQRHGSEPFCGGCHLWVTLHAGENLNSRISKALRASSNSASLFSVHAPWQEGRRPEPQPAIWISQVSPPGRCSGAVGRCQSPRLPTSIPVMTWPPSREWKMEAPMEGGASPDVSSISPGLCGFRDRPAAYLRASMHAQRRCSYRLLSPQCLHRRRYGGHLALPTWPGRWRGGGAPLARSLITHLACSRPCCSRRQERPASSDTYNPAKQASRAASSSYALPSFGSDVHECLLTGRSAS